MATFASLHGGGELSGDKCRSLHQTAVRVETNFRRRSGATRRSCRDARELADHVARLETAGGQWRINFLPSLLADCTPRWAAAETKLLAD